MYIREDLLNKIKEIFNIKKFTYIGTGKHGFSNNDLLIFDCDDENIAIEIVNIDFYFMYKTKESSDHDGYFYTIMPRYFLFIDENKTCLKIDKNITSFSGKAFDFTSELVLLAMERNV